jgi:S-adenosylmethionine hydrolase
MAIITLTTDWGTKDPYVAVIKGIVLSHLPTATVVDISHEVSPFDYIEAHFILKNAFPYFPKNTIHIIGMEDHFNENKTNPLCIKYQEQYFLGNDTGIFALMFGNIEDGVVEIDISSLENRTFIVRDVLVKAAIHLAKGGQLEDLGEKKTDLNEKIISNPVYENNCIRGYVSYVDSFGNLITNISEELFSKSREGRRFAIVLKTKSQYIKEISYSYNHAKDNSIFAYFNSENYLEISMGMDKAAKMLNMRFGDLIRIEFDVSSNR